jgi:hypothetical protein
VDGQPLFPGESDVDQLYIIQRLLGAITTHQNTVFMKNPRFNGYQFGDILATNPTTLEHRYRSKLVDGSLPAEGLDLMKQCLRCSLSLAAWAFCRKHTAFLVHARLTSWGAGYVQINSLEVPLKSYHESVCPVTCRHCPARFSKSRVWPWHPKAALRCSGGSAHLAA